MAVVQFDVFDIDDPNGTPLGTIDDTEAEALDFRVGYRGDPGEGHILINRHHAAAALIAPDRIYKAKIPAIDSGYLYAFIQKDADYTLASPIEQAGETLELFGPGLKALFAQARLYWTPYAPLQPDRGSDDHAHNLWWWIDEPYGAIATRVIEEGINQPGAPLADMDVTFTRTHDSDGVPWANIADEWQTTVGTDVLTILSELEQHGDFYIEVLPDLTVNAYQTSPGRDLTGSVHVQKGAELMTSLRRRIHGRPAIDHLILEDSDGNYSLEVAPGASGRGNWGYYKAPTNDDTTLNKIGQEVIRASRASLTPNEFEVDTLAFLPGPEGSDNGEFWTADTILVSTGSGAQDYDEAEHLVTGLRFSLDAAVVDVDATTRRRSLRVVVECNVESVNTVDPQAGFGGPRAPHSHAEILCQALEPGTETASRLYLTGTSATPLAVSAGWTNTDDMITRTLSLTTTSTATGTGSVTWDHVNQTAASFGLLQGRITLSNAGLLAAVQSGGTFRIQMRIGIRHGIGINEAAAREYLEGCIRVYRPGTATFIGTISAVGDATGTVYANTDASGTVANRSMAGDAAGVPSAVSTDVLVVELGTKHTAPTTGGAGGRIYHGDSAASDLPEDDTTLTNLNTWIEFRTITAPAGGGNHPDLVGEDRDVARCDHRHHILSDRDPTSADDITQGYPTTTLWTNTETHTSFVLADEDTGDWDPFATTSDTVPSHSHDADEITGLEDVTLRWEAVTDGEDIFVWDGDDLVHEWAEYA